MMLFALGCGFLGLGTEEEAETVSRPVQLVLEKPHSTFVPLRNTVQVEVGKPLIMESRHIGPAQLQQVTIAINDPDDPDGNVTTFPPELATVRVLNEDQLLSTDIATPALPTKDWTLSLQWVGFTPGTYNLTLQATDVDGKQSDPVTQRIEVR